MSDALLPIGEPVIVAGIYNGVVLKVDAVKNRMLVKFDGWAEELANWYTADKVLSIMAGGRSSRRRVPPASAPVVSRPAVSGSVRRSVRTTEPKSPSKSTQSPAAEPPKKRQRTKLVVESQTSSEASPDSPSSDFEESDSSSTTTTENSESSASSSSASDAPGSTNYRSEITSPGTPVRPPKVPPIARSSTAKPAAAAPASAGSAAAVKAEDQASTPSTEQAPRPLFSAFQVFHHASLQIPKDIPRPAKQLIPLRQPTSIPLNPSLDDQDLAILLSAAFVTSIPSARHRLIQALFSTPHPIHSLQAAIMKCAPQQHLRFTGFSKLEAEATSAGQAYYAHRIADMANGEASGHRQPLLSILAVTTIKSVSEMRHKDSAGAAAQLMLPFVYRLFPLEGGAGFADAPPEGGSDDFTSYADVAAQFIYILFQTAVWHAVSECASLGEARKQAQQLYDYFTDFSTALFSASGSEKSKPKPHEHLPSRLVRLVELIINRAATLPARVAASLRPTKAELAIALDDTGNKAPFLVSALEPDKSTVDAMRAAVELLAAGYTKIDLGEGAAWFPFANKMVAEAQKRVTSTLPGLFEAPDCRQLMQEKIQSCLSECVAVGDRWYAEYRLLAAKLFSTAPGPKPFFLAGDAVRVLMSAAV